MRPKQVLIRDNESIKNILVQVNLENSSVIVISNFSAWENLALIMEALGITAEQCVKEGIDREQIDREIREYLTKVLTANTFIRTGFTPHG